MNKLSDWLNKTIDPNKQNIQENKNSSHIQNKPEQKIPEQQTSQPVNQQKNPKKKWNKNKPKHSPAKKIGKLRVIAIGGLNEVGKNCMAFEYGSDIIVIDAGLQFPEEEMLGIDFVIPDMDYLEKNRSKIKALVITHGHLDHIGAVPHFIQKFPHIPIIATKLTIGMIQKQIEEYGIKNPILKTINPGKETINIGQFTMSFFRVNHSIPDGMGVFLETPAGNVMHTGDFKFDFRPADGIMMDMGHLANLGRKGVDILFADSTNAQKKGYCVSEYVIGRNLEGLIGQAKGRLIIATFSSLIGRLQQIVDIAHKEGRKIFVSGRSMLKNMELAINLGYLKMPKGALHKLSSKSLDLPPNKILILTTGSQGESMSALTRIALDEHPHIKIQKGDTVVFSSSPIPGNERSTANVVNNLFRLGAHVITNDGMDVHTSGHAYQEDLKMMQALVKPKYTVPIHGEFYMRMAHREMLINEYGLEEKQVVILENGSILELENSIARKSKEKASANLIMIDGVGVGDVGTRVIRDRQIMSENGVIIVLFRAFDKSKRLVGDPDIISRGFIYLKESKQIAEEAKEQARKAFEEAVKDDPNINLNDLKQAIARRMRTFIVKRLDREPMVIPLVVFV